MDQSNYDDIISLARDQSDVEKVKLFLESNDTITDKNVPDPYYGDITDFQYVFNLIDTTAEIISLQLS